MLCLSIRTVHADSLAVRDLNPLLSGYELPPSLSSALNPVYRNDIQVSYAISNTSLEQQSSNEHLVVDGELHRWQFTATHAINSHWNVSIELPYQSISGGTLDRFIEHFHNDFNLPNGNRANWPVNRLLINYARNGQTLYHLENSQSGIGDMTLRAGWQFDAQIVHTATVWFSAKVPTGNANKLTGSGAVDAAVSLAAQQQVNNDLQTYEQMSLSWLGNGTRMQQEQKHSVWSAMAGIDWRLFNTMDVVAQLNAHSAIFDSELRLLGQAMQFSVGPRYHAQQWAASFFITEDIAVDTAPDVQFQFTLEHHF